MKTFTILCIGKLKEPYLRDAAAEYQKRLSADCKLNIVELPAEKLPDVPSQKQIDAALAAEEKRILEKVPENAAVIALCVEGKSVSSEAFSALLSDFALRGKSSVVFIIGGSFGLSDAVKRRSDLKLSVSPMTFPHQLFRVILLEQLYRAIQIERGTKYHK